MTDVIRDLPTDDRPRERLLRHGAESLSNAELLALVLGSGVRGKNAIQLARQVIGKGLRTLRDRDLNELAATPGIGAAKTARIAAVFELSKRLQSDVPEEPPHYDTAEFGAMLVRTIGHLPQERLGAAALDARYRLRETRDLFIGTIDHTCVSTRDVAQFLLAERATAVVLYHNHPSGDPTPSNEDLAFTRKLKESLGTMDIALLDHLVIGTNRFHSMQQRGQL